MVSLSSIFDFVFSLFCTSLFFVYVKTECPVQHLTLVSGSFTSQMLVVFLRTVSPHISTPALMKQNTSKALTAYWLFVTVWVNSVHVLTVQCLSRISSFVSCNAASMSAIANLWVIILAHCPTVVTDCECDKGIKNSIFSLYFYFHFFLYLRIFKLNSWTIYLC